MTIRLPIPRRAAAFPAVLLALLLAAPGGWLVSQETAVENVESQVKALAPLLETREGEKYWACVNRLEGLGKEAAPLLREQLTSAGEKTRLGCSKALLYLGDLEAREQALEALGDLARDAKSPSVQRDAIQLFVLNHEDPDAIDAMLPTLEKLFDESLDPTVMIPLARTLWEVKFADRARDRLVDLLDSKDPEIRHEVALTLAELDYFENGVREILRSLKDEPSPRGRRAAALERISRLSRSLERRLERGDLLLEGTNPEKLLKIKETRIRELEDKLERAAKGQGVGGDGRRSSSVADNLLNEAIEKIEQLYVNVEKAQREKLLMSALRNMVRSLDEYSTFMDADESQALTESLEGNYAGIGAQVSKLPGQPLEILRPIYGGPAFASGIRSGDQILEVNDIATSELQIDEITRELKGPEDTEVKLKYWRRGWSEPKEVTLTRARIDVPSVYHELLPGAIGYIHLTQFGYSSVDDFKTALETLEKDQIQGLVFDLRGNPGGLLSAAVAITDLFVSGDKPIVTQKGRGDPGENEKSTWPTAAARTDYPIVVLINQRSASASEVVSGALQDFGRAVLVGKRTFGKGSVQNIIPLRSKEGCKLKLTVQYYFLPSDRCIHTIRDENGKVITEGGVEPDVKVGWASVPVERQKQRNQLLRNEKILDYVDRHFDTLAKLVPLGDRDRTESYPEFDALYAALATDASQEDVRFVLREKARRKVEDERKRQFPFDLQEDVQLQRGILELLALMRAQPGDLPEYSWIDATAGSDSDDSEEDADESAERSDVDDRPPPDDAAEKPAPEKSDSGDEG